jgi:hypothetical protein
MTIVNQTATTLDEGIKNLMAGAKLTMLNGQQLWWQRINWLF